MLHPSIQTRKQGLWQDEKHSAVQGPSPHICEARPCDKDETWFIELSSENGIESDKGLAKESFIFKTDINFLNIHLSLEKRERERKKSVVSA